MPLLKSYQLVYPVISLMILCYLLQLKPPLQSAQSYFSPFHLMQFHRLMSPENKKKSLIMLFGKDYKKDDFIEMKKKESSIEKTTTDVDLYKQLCK